jgi:hypothetical protein
VTTVPTWAAYAVSIGTPVVTFLGVLLAQLIARRGAVELETRSNREETMRTLRWAAELSVSPDPAKSQLGFSQLKALADSEMLDSAQQLFIDGALDAVVSEPVEEIEEAASANEPVAVVRLPDDELGPPSIRPGDPEVGLSPEPGDEGSD